MMMIYFNDVIKYFYLKIMGILSGLKSVGSWFAGGSGEKGMDIIKDVGSWIDEQQYTEQEKAETAAARVEAYARFMQQTIDENSERSRTRRSLALLVLRWWIFLLTLSAILYKIDPVWSKYLFDIASYHGVVALVGGIGAFFFGSHLIRTK